MLQFIQELWRDYRRYRAAQRRAQIKSYIFWEEIGKVRRGEVDSFQNCLYRQSLYDAVDATSDEEILA